MANKQNSFGSCKRPKRLETTSQIVRRQRLQKALMKSERAEKELKALGIHLGGPSASSPPPEKVGAVRRFFRWLFRKD